MSVIDVAVQVSFSCMSRGTLPTLEGARVVAKVMAAKEVKSVDRRLQLFVRILKGVDLLVGCTAGKYLVTGWPCTG
jgi:hypothetical protein